VDGDAFEAEFPGTAHHRRHEPSADTAVAFAGDHVHALQIAAGPPQGTRGRHPLDHGQPRHPDDRVVPYGDHAPV
jgi:hypothetical protein